MADSIEDRINALRAKNGLPPIGSGATAPSAPVLSPLAPPETGTKQLQRPVTPAVPQTPRKVTKTITTVEVEPEVPAIGESSLRTDESWLNAMAAAPLETDQYRLADEWSKKRPTRLDQALAIGDYFQVPRPKLQEPEDVEMYFDLLQAKANEVKNKANYDAAVYTRAKPLATLHRIIPGITPEQIKELQRRKVAGLPIEETVIPLQNRSTANHDAVTDALDKLAVPQLRRPADPGLEASDYRKMFLEKMNEYRLGGLNAMQQSTDAWVNFRDKYLYDYNGTPGVPPSYAKGKE